MAASLDLASLHAMAQTLQSSFLSQVIVLLLFVLVLRYVAASWRNSFTPYEVQTCPPINPHVHYRYGVSQMQGRRPYMEDRFTAIADLNGDPTQSFYGIFDGHGGDGAAEYCVQAMCQNIIRDPLISKEPIEALKNGFLRTDHEYLEIATRKNTEDGTTAVVMFTQGKEIFVAHTGDSRAVLVHQSGNVSVLTSDHKPNRPDERRRIQDLGGSVVFWGVWRVEGILAVSRAIGDRMLKPYVVAAPEVKQFTRTESDRYVVLASDGVWDILSNDEAAEVVLQYNDPQLAAQHLMDEAYARGSMDNICVMVIDLRA
ncbi:hypothetical protein CCR75_005855 [Bremia lactucae]|uniref:PPM-type phosphatase domain-containing protein n=1 Tax=Bremia lactucae TaxID=4779 RepID=A0A976FGE9_BRELC|nr:hypothetical protein CCR75_005855 [Bremia lactucae]